MVALGVLAAVVISEPNRQRLAVGALRDMRAHGIALVHSIGVAHEHPQVDWMWTRRFRAHGIRFRRALLQRTLNRRRGRETAQILEA